MRPLWIGRTHLLGLSFFLGFALALGGCAHAPRPTPTEPDLTPLTSGPATQPPPAAEPPARLATPNLSAHMRRNAPLRYVVKRGDTLWDIASKYLADPWYWPQLWDSNPGISNPHWIYPGEVLVLSRRMNGQPQLSGNRTMYLSPRVRTEPLPNAIPVIRYSAIRPFLRSVRAVSADTLSKSPYVVSLQGQHLVGAGQIKVYIRNLPSNGPDSYELVHPEGSYRAYRTGEALARKVVPVGRVHVQKRGGEIAIGVISKSYREARPGDRLLPIDNHLLLHDFTPQAASKPLTAHIISAYGGITEIGQYDVVALDRGARGGMQRGDVLNVYAPARSVSDPVTGAQVTLPDVKTGELLVFKVDKRVSFGLIMQATHAIHTDYLVHSPDAT